MKVDFFESINLERLELEENSNVNELFSKFDKNFCSFKCLKEWIQKNPH